MAAVRVTQTKCPECSASIRVTSTADHMRCEYCGMTLQIEHKRAPRTPTMTAPRTVYVPPPMPVPARLAMWLGPILPIVIVGSQLWPQLRGYVPGDDVRAVDCCRRRFVLSCSLPQWRNSGTFAPFTPDGVMALRWKMPDDLSPEPPSRKYRRYRAGLATRLDRIEAAVGEVRATMRRLVEATPHPPSQRTSDRRADRLDRDVHA